MATTMVITVDIAGVIITDTIMAFIPTANPGTAQDTMMDTVMPPARIFTRDGQPEWSIQGPGPQPINPVQLQAPQDHLTANPVVLTVKTMCIQTGMAMYTVKKEIPGKHERMDHGKKAMCRLPEQQLMTDAARAQRVHQLGQRLQGPQPPLLVVRQHAVAQPTVPLRVAIAGVEQAAGAIKVLVVN